MWAISDQDTGMQDQAAYRGKHPCDGDAVKGRGVSARWGMAPPPGLHVLHAYTRLKMGSSKVSMVVRNMSESPIFLKRGYRWHMWFWLAQCHLQSYPLKWKPLGRVEVMRESMSVTMQQENLLEKLNLDGLSN